jgi:hypothetical protein
MGALPEEGSALDCALAIQGNHLESLIAKGDWHMRQGNQRPALASYRAAMDFAAGAQPLPSSLRSELARIQHLLDNSGREYQTHLLEMLKNRGLGSAGTDRFQRAVDILIGKRKLYLQQPTNFYLPELPQRQFYERAELAWADEFEMETPTIKDELNTALVSGKGIKPYVGPNDRARSRDYTGDPRWSAFHLYQDGEIVPENASQCPRTMAALEKIPMFRVADSSPSVMFSLLLPGARILPHHGLTNVRLICHLPLIVPANCGRLRVGNEERSWEEGRLLIFDDSIEHEAWNSGVSLRAVLLFDIWRPELSEKERELVGALFSAIGRFRNPSQQ